MSDLSFLETDSDAIYRTVITELEKHCGEPLYPGDERRIFGDALVALIVSVYNQVNASCKAKMLQYASGKVLDALGERYGCFRLPSVKASTILRFSVKESIANNIIIEVGTRVTPNNEVYFQTTKSAVLQAGTLYIDVPAECCEAGAKYNDYAVGTINQIVDVIPFIDSVENTIITKNGDDGEPYPDADDGTGDEHYRNRIKFAPTSLSVAGPADAYKYHALKADATIADVAILNHVEDITRSLKPVGNKIFLGGSGYILSTLSIRGYESGELYTVKYENDLLEITFTNGAPSTVDLGIKREKACEIKIIPIMQDGSIPDEEVLKKVYEACNATDVRPMTDKVIVTAPEQVKYDIDIVYYTTVNDESECINAIEDVGGAIDMYKEWQDTKMGRAINPDKLRSLCLAPKTGKECTRIIVNKPEYKTLTATQVASFSGNLKVKHVVEG